LVEIVARSEHARHGRAAAFVLVCFDILAMAVAFVLAGATAYSINTLWLDRPLVPAGDMDRIIVRAEFFAIYAIAVLFFFDTQGRYRERRDFWSNLGVVLQGAALALAVEVLIQYAAKWSFSRLWLIGSWLWAVLLLSLARPAARMVLGWFDRWRRPLIVVASTKSDRVVRNFVAAKEGSLAIGRELVPPIGWAADPKPVIENILAMPEARSGLVLFVLTLDELPLVLRHCRRLEQARIDFAVTLDLGAVGRRGLFTDLCFPDGVPVLRGSVHRLERPLARAIKRTMDIVLTSIGLLVLLPLMGMVAVLVKRDGGSATYSHTRIGRHGKPFKCHKFRSMVLGADRVLQDLLDRDPAARAQWEANFKLEDDPRITKLGKFLRSSSIDELPQLFNVLRGDMSLIGPRPVVAEELVKYYAEETQVYLSVRPGLSGLWQVSGRSLTDYEERVDLDARYIRLWSIWLDISIIVRTFGAVVKRHGAV
jgi:exopolysaccharide biosynthesis polyprenyl glycosylphosphotransferase